jgi:CubicO group peptidase (beta-lactamase class C family)
MMPQPPAHTFEVEGLTTRCAIRRAQGFSGSAALNVLFQAVGRRAFPGAAFAALLHNNVVLQGAVGRLTYDETSDDVTLSTIFDVASLTKVVATTSMAMLLHQRGQLNLQQPVVDVLPEFRGQDKRREQVTIKMLLAHSSGLPAYVKFFEMAAGRAELLRLALQVPLETEPLTRSVYSDIGFIILGEMLEKIAGESLDYFCRREVFLPLDMNSTAFNPPPHMRVQIPPTRDEHDFRVRVIQGEVHDENAAVMGGVSGHAGLFSNTGDLMRFARAILEAKPEIFSRDTIEVFTTRQLIPKGTSRALGWDTPSQPSQSGKHFSAHSFGHLGYTGTSLWIDAEHDLAIALLTNRTWPDNKSELIKQIRPEFHDALLQELLSQ